MNLWKECKNLKTGEMCDLPDLAMKYLDELELKCDGKFNFLKNECNHGELAAFCAFAISFPTNFLALVDTYNVLK